MTSYQSSSNEQPQTFAPSQPMVNRRQPLEMSLPLAASGGGGGARHVEADERGLDYSSPIDVPAFLRRQS